MKRIGPLLAILCWTVGLWGCRPASNIPKPTKEFYCNDFAGAFPAAVRATIVAEGKRLYEETSEDETISGIQIVFATFAVETAEDIASYNLSDIYNQWEIGTDDMGVLVVYFYLGDPDKPETLELEEVRIEVGFAMEMYLSPMKMGDILDETIMADESEAIGTVHLLYELLTVMYVDIFGYDAFNYDLDEYQEYLDNYDPYSDYEGLWGWILYVVLSPYSGWWEKGLLVLLGLSVFGIGGGLVKTVGGGGRSGGMGLRRRR
jgi:hypothetical protein